MNENFRLDIHIACDCSCESPGNIVRKTISCMFVRTPRSSFFVQGFEINSAQCNYGGNSTCGICKCDDSHSGRLCEVSLYTFQPTSAIIIEIQSVQVIPIIWISRPLANQTTFRMCFAVGAANGKHLSENNVHKISSLFCLKVFAANVSAIRIRIRLR